jgi:hypothetical protein
MALAACGGEPPPVVAPPPPEPRASSSAVVASEDPVGNVCRQEVADLEDWLRAVEAAGLPLTLSLLDDGSKLVHHQGPKIVEPGPLVHITAKQTLLNGTVVGASEELEKSLLELINLRKRMMPRSPFIQSPRCYLAIDGDVAWSRVAGVAERAGKAGVARLTFVFAEPSRRVPSPPPSPIDTELARLAKSSQAKRQQMIVELMAYVYQDCPEALKVIAHMGVNEVADFKQVLLDGLPPALAVCRCAPDVTAVKALHWTLFGNPLPTSGLTVGLAGPGAPSAPAVELGPEVSWSQAHHELLKHHKREGLLRLRVLDEADNHKSGSPSR